jgi:hypothetical protein
MQCKHPVVTGLSACSCHLPYVTHRSVFEAQRAKVELAPLDPVSQFDAGDRDRSDSEPYEPQHWTDAKLHAAVVLFDRTIEIF